MYDLQKSFISAVGKKRYTNSVFVGDNDMVGLYGREQQMNDSKKAIAIVNLGLMWALKIGASCGIIKGWVIPSGYGCFCGVTDWENLNTLQQEHHTMDEFDKLCLQHDLCYVKTRKSPCGGRNPKYIPYFWYPSLFDNLVKCGVPHSDCMEAVCQCDTNFVNSIVKLLETENCPKKNPGCQKSKKNEK